VIRALAALLILASPAAAEQSIWKQVDNWVVTGDVETGVCLATTQYTATGQQLLIGEYEHGWSIAVNGTNAVQGATYLAQIITSDGSTEALAGMGLGNGLIIFKLGHGTVMQGLLTSDTVEFKGIGVFRIDGAFEAMSAIHACYEDVTGKDA
jgi:hypothetical protein